MSSTTDNAQEGDDSNTVRDGEKVCLPFSFRDSARRGPPPAPPLAGRTLRCTDTGRLTVIDGSMAAAIGSEAARSGLAVEGYLRRLHYALERSDA